MFKKIIVSIIALLLVNAGYAYKEASAAGWNATINAVGEKGQAVDSYAVIIGVDANEQKLPAPPAPPEYTVKMDLVGEEGKLLGKDVRREGEKQYVWTLAVDPQGNAGSSGPRSSVVKWNAADFSGGKYMIKKGYHGEGGVIVPDMSTASGITVTGNEGKQYFQINLYQ